MRSLLKLTWLELKIFAREPLGLIGTLLVPSLVAWGIGRALVGQARPSNPVSSFVTLDLPVLAALLAALNAVLSLVTIVSIYREGGILKRLRATPLRPTTILSAHVLVKFFMTIATLLVMAIIARRVVVMPMDARALSFTLATLMAMLSVLSIGFLIASVVPTARFAQPLGAIILYPMLFLSGLFVPVAAFPSWLQSASRLLPLTYAVSLMRGMWRGDSWFAHGLDIAALALFGVVFTAMSARWFRWE